MPKVDICNVPTETGTNYPAEFQDVVAGRERRRLGNAAGLDQFGVNLTRLKPGSASSLRHWHVVEDEFVFVLEGELVLVEEGTETVLGLGDAAGFKANSGNGHHLINRSKRDAVYLEIGTRSAFERAYYCDVDLIAERNERGLRFLRRSEESAS